MRLILVFFIFCSTTFSTVAQEDLFRGFLKSSDDFEPISYAQIKDSQTGKIVQSDELGYFEIKTQNNHTLEISGMGLKTQHILVKSQMFIAIQQIALKYKMQELPEFIVTEKTKYQTDSIERHQTYQLDLERKKERPKLDKDVDKGGTFGLIINAPLSKTLEKVSKKSKKRLQFQKNFANWEQQKYIEQKYNSEKVSSITGLQNDSLGWFMNTFPMSYEMARQSDEDEINYWIKSNFDFWKTNADSLILKIKIKD